MTAMNSPAAALCIFCGGTPLTKEHIWADWLEPYVPRDMDGYSVLRAVAHLDRSQFEASERGGDIHNWQVRCVCASCNNGWMSALQVEAKPTVIRLLRGEQFVLGVQQQGAVAAWVAMAVMAGDAGDRGGRAVQKIDLEFFRASRGPPLNWRILIGDYSRDQWRAHWVRHPMQIEEKIEPGLDRTATQFNAQFTTFVTARLYANVSVAPSGTAHIRLPFKPDVERKLRQIWPPVRGEISWPPKALTDDDADHAASIGIERGLSAGRMAARPR